MADLTQIIERQGWEEFCHCSVTQALNLDLKEKKKKESIAKFDFDYNWTLRLLTFPIAGEKYLVKVICFTV